MPGQVLPKGSLQIALKRVPRPSVWWLTGAFRLLLADSLNGVALTASPTLHEGRPVYWYLCIFAEGDVVRAELSCPLTCSGGYFTDFLERIVLIGDDDADLIRTQMPDEDGGADFEVEVVRKLS